MPRPLQTQVRDERGDLVHPKLERAERGGAGTVITGTPGIPAGSRILRFVVEKVTRVTRRAKNPNIIE